ncbi:MAG: amino acid racemase [Tissierellia bacterium]|nr:amino acid racemase [Tissierellia bacterium]
MKLGILGGMGPLATCTFYKMIIDMTYANCDQEHIDLMILSHASMPDRTNVIVNNLDENIIIEATKKDIELFEKAGVDNIVVTCNTFHHFIDEFKKNTSINVINMIEEAVKEVLKTFGENANIYVLGTDGTNLSGIYKKYATKYNLNFLDIPEEIQKNIMEIIYEVKATNITKSLKFENLLNTLRALKTDSIFILACTELSCLEIPKEFQEKTLDAMKILAKCAIVKSGYKLK